MAKKEIITDFWVRDLLKEANIKFDAQGSSIKEIDEALKTASKSKTGNVGYPEFVGVVKDFLLVIENKADISNHIKRNEKDLIADDVRSIQDYAINGALFYGKHLAENTSYKKILAFGISGNEKRHKISPIFIDERLNYKELVNVETFALFNEKNIDEYYTKNILKEETPEEKTTVEILNDAKKLHEDLRNYGSIQDKDKPLIVSGILLALREIDFQGFQIENLNGDRVTTDGDKIYQAIERNLNRVNVSPQVKKNKLLSQFLVIKDTKVINEISYELGKTPLKHYAEFLYENIYKNIKYIQSSEDYVGRFYGEFMSYSGGDGQSLGIVLTPKHITELFCGLAELKTTDKVFDPCCGTGGFLIAAMHNMVVQAENHHQEIGIRKNQLHGLELQPYMFTIATTNMILRGDGKSNLEQEDFLKIKPSILQEKAYTVGMMNPPYSMGSKSNQNLYEINFTESLLNSIVVGGKVIVIVPQSSMTGKTKEEKIIKENILKYHTLEGVITLNKNTFYGVGTNPCIAVFTAGIPHYKDKEVKFINFENDGFEVQKHRGLVETIEAKDKKQHLLDVWFDRIEAESKFCVKTTIEYDDEWLHSFYYFNDEIPTDADFEKTVADYLTFEFSMIMQNRGYLFDNEDDEKKMYEVEQQDVEDVEPLEKKEWKEFVLGSIFKISRGKRLIEKNRKRGEVQYYSASSINNGLTDFISNPLFLESNCIIVTTFLDAYFVKGTFTASDEITMLKNDYLNKHNGRFVVSSIIANKDKFAFGYKAFTERIKRQTILLPVNSFGEPDYEYMENYIKHIEVKKLQQYIEYRNLKQN